RHKGTTKIDSLFWQEWQKHQDYLYRCCVKWMGGNSTNAEDALSMAMLKAREKIQRCFETIQNFKAWLVKLTYNLCMDLLKESNRYNQKVEALDLVISLADGSTQGRDPFLVAVYEELEDFCRLAIDDLPKRLRETFVLLFDKQYSYKEIATELNISESNLRKRISQGRAILQKRRQEEYEKQEEIVIVENQKIESSQPQELDAEIVAAEIPQEAILSEEKSEPILIEATVEEELREIETFGNGGQQLFALSVLLKLLRVENKKPKGKKQQKYGLFSRCTNIGLALLRGRMNISGVGILLTQKYKERLKWLTHKVIEVQPHYLYNFGKGELKALEKQLNWLIREKFLRPSAAKLVYKDSC
ncbi:MAG: RNA polymerase sigma factor, partial [Trichodesmium sp. St19_bin1]|nr:RNA polymerase sigma factor [Trichodesmium sp. St19_bin1]